MAKKKKATNRSGMDKDLGDLFKHINNQKFESKEELENFLSQTVGKSIDEIVPKKMGRKNNIEKARELVFEAYESPPAKGKKLVEKALKLDPNNADGYIYLAENEQSLEGSIQKYKEAVEAGKNSIGKKDFEDFKGHFWGFHETRPYMRARAGLALYLYLAEKFEEAIGHYQEMMVLNPNDNQGIRYQLAAWLVDQDRETEYLKLYKDFKDDASAPWKYTYALYLFKKEGKTKKSNLALKEAYKANQYVAKFLSGAEEIPDYMPEYIQMGHESEAISCLNDSGKIWLETAGALDWIREFYQKQKNIN